MTNNVSRFYNSIEDVARIEQSELIDLFIYYLTVELGGDFASARDVAACFTACDLTPPAWISPHLSKGLSSKPQRYIKVEGGYKLQRHRREELSKKLGAERVIAQTSAELRKLESRFPDGPARKFLAETIDCFEAGANRATIIMCWILTMDHLYKYVFAHHLPAFNAELLKIKDKRVRVSEVKSLDDFSDIPEGKFIEILRASNIISGDIKKILEQKLGIRNSSAHPSGIHIARSKVIDFVEDLIPNILLKYSI